MERGFVNFAEIKQRYQENPLPILRQLVGQGKIERGDYVALNPRRNDRHLGSFRIKISTGGFYDFATGDKGGSIIDLAAYVNNCGIVEAAERISDKNWGQLKNRSSFRDAKYFYKSIGYADHSPIPRFPEKNRIDPKFIWERSIVGDHPYLRKKKIQGTPGGGDKFTNSKVCREIEKNDSDTKSKPEYQNTYNKIQELPGARVNLYKGKSNLVIPLTDRVPEKPEDLEIKGLQFIHEDGQKRFMGSIKGLFFIASYCGGSKDIIIISEGYATARSIDESTDFFVVAGMSSCNMKNVAEKMAEQFPNSKIIIAADNDEAGRKAVTEAQKAISGKVWCAAVYPSPEFNDFNDMYQAKGKREVRKIFELIKEMTDE